MKQPDDTRVNTVSLLCLLALYVLCWVFDRASFLQNLKNPGHLSLTNGRMTSICIFVRGMMLPRIYDKYDVFVLMHIKV